MEKIVSDFQNAGPLRTRASKYLDSFFLRNTVGTTSIYDHGCGYGGWTNHLALLTDAKASIYDPDAEAYAYTRKLLGDRFTDADGPVDKVICFAVLELLEEQEQIDLLKKFATRLRGRLIVQYNFYNPLALRWLAVRLKHGNPINWHEKDRFHRTYFKRQYVEKMFRKAGFRIMEKCHPSLENHIPYTLNNWLGPIVPARFHMTFYYALEKIG